jgi:hypothetical protein
MKHLENFDWNQSKRERELSTEIQRYEVHAQREIENNKVAREDKIRDNSQRYLQLLYKRYFELIGKDYPNPKFEIKK